ncbi:hypothetical protein AMTRI_Chr03g146290 [Amborella trichopoda]
MTLPLLFGHVFPPQAVGAYAGASPFFPYAAWSHAKKAALCSCIMRYVASSKNIADNKQLYCFHHCWSGESFLIKISIQEVLPYILISPTHFFCIRLPRLGISYFLPRGLAWPGLCAPSLDLCTLFPLIT